MYDGNENTGSDKGNHNSPDQAIGVGPQKAGQPSSLDTDVSLYVLSVSPLGPPGLEGKPFSAFKCISRAL
jgi:hypothetical protein